MKTLYFVKILHVVLVSMLVNAYVNGLDNQTHILCTKVSVWKDAMNSCLSKGGMPLTHDDIEMANISEKINRTVWTAEYTAISNQRWNTSAGLDRLRDTMCASQTIHLGKIQLDLLINRVENIKYKNCTEKRAYVCDSVKDSSTENQNRNYVYLNETTWMNAETSCISKNRHLSSFTQLDIGTYILAVVSELMEPQKLDVWVGLVASLDHRTVQKEDGVEQVNIVKLGTYGNSAGFRMIDGKLPDEFPALCGFESLQSIRPSLFTDCTKAWNTADIHSEIEVQYVENKDKKGYPLDDSHSDGEMTPNAPKAILASSEDTSWLSFTIIVSCSTLFVMITGSTVLCLYMKRKRRELRTVDGAIANNGPGHYDYTRGGELDVATDESRNFDAYSLACEPGVPETQTVSNPVYVLHQVLSASDPDDNVYDSKDRQNEKGGQEGQIDLHIYDRANYSNGELLYDNKM